MVLGQEILLAIGVDLHDLSTSQGTLCLGTPSPVCWNVAGHRLAVASCVPGCSREHLSKAEEADSLKNPGMFLL